MHCCVHACAQHDIHHMARCHQHLLAPSHNVRAALQSAHKCHHHAVLPRLRYGWCRYNTPCPGMFMYTAYYATTARQLAAARR